MADHHVLETPKFVWVIKIVQLVLSVVVLALAGVNVSAIAYNAHALTIFTVSLLATIDIPQTRDSSNLSLLQALFSIIIITYYLIAIHASTKL